MVMPRGGTLNHHHHPITELLGILVICNKFFNLQQQFATPSKATLLNKFLVAATLTKTYTSSAISSDFNSQISIVTCCDDKFSWSACFPTIHCCHFYDVLCCW